MSVGGDAVRALPTMLGHCEGILSTLPVISSSPEIASFVRFCYIPRSSQKFDASASRQINDLRSELR